MDFLADIQDDARLGGKARSLARLAAAGLSTPPGFVITDRLFRSWVATRELPSRLDESGLRALDRIVADLHTQAWPAGFSDELRARLAQVGAARWSVRSSFATEDRAGGLGAGVYESCVGVATAEVEVAIRCVLASAASAGAVAYALAHGMEPSAPPVSVLVHAYTQGDAEGSAAWAPGMAEPLLWVRAGNLSSDPAVRMRETVACLGQRLGAVELEWVVKDDRPVFLQMRPYQPAPAPAPWAGWDDLGGQPREGWKWDVAHNPLPLSPAQAGLVALTDEHCRVGFRQRVLGGYLFYRPEDDAGTALSFGEAEQRFAELRAETESALRGTSALEPALSLFLRVHETILGVVQPALRRERARLARLLSEHVPTLLPLLPALYEGVQSVAAERHRRAAAAKSAVDPAARAQAVAAYLDLFGDEAAIWDVAHPTHREQPQALFSTAPAHVSPEPSPSTWSAEATRVRGQLPPDLHREWDACLAGARGAAALGEDDDWLYARAQASVRRALLTLGQQLAGAGRLAHPDEVFWLPLALCRELACGRAETTDLRTLAHEARHRWEVARRNPPQAPVAAGSVIFGAGTAGRALGRVCVHQSGETPSIPAGMVVVAQTLLPTELPLIDAIALVTEVGGPLDHVAAQARERGLPAVVGAAGALAALADGDLVLVDADHGLVVRLMSRGERRA